MGTVRIAVTGATGMLTRAIQHAGGAAVVAWPSSRVDIRDEGRVRAAIAQDAPAAVINAAAFTDVDGAEARRDEAFELNERGAGNVASACAAAGIRIVHVSTDYVFDGMKDRPWVESDPTRPLGAYGESKLAGEHAVAARCRDHVIARTAWLYGPWSRRNFVDTMLHLTATRPSVDVVADAWGSPTYSIDLARALLFLATAPVQGIFHASNSGRTTWHGLASRIVELAGRTCEVRPVGQAAFPRPARRPANSALDTSRLAAAGHTMRGWEEALAEYLREYALKR